MKLFGDRINIATVIISVVLGMIICSHTLCSRIDINTEGFYGLDYDMGKGVPGDTWTVSPKNGVSTEKPMYASLSDNVGKIGKGTGRVDPSHLDFFADTKFDPKCCATPNQYSSSNGCACFTPQQMKFLSTRTGTPR